MAPLPIDDLYRRQFRSECRHCDTRTINGAFIFPKDEDRIDGLSCTKCSCGWTIDGVIVVASDTCSLGQLEKLGDNLGRS